MALVLDNAGVARALNLVGCVHAVEDALLDLAAQRTVEGGVASLPLGAGGLHFRSAALLGAGIAGWEEWRAFGAAPARTWRLYETASGKLLAVIDGAHLEALAGAAAGAVAVRHLAPAGASRLGVLALDGQTSLEVQAIAATHPLKDVTVQDGRLADELSKAIGLPVRTASAGEVVARSQLLLAGEAARLDPGSLPAGLHVHAAPGPGWEGTAGTVDGPAALAAIVAQEAAGRVAAGQTTAYLARPSAVLTLALGVRALRMARELKLGAEAAT